MWLIGAIPTSVHQINATGWCFVFGESKIGQEVSAAYLLPKEQSYIRFAVIAAPPTGGSDPPAFPTYQVVSKRPLTAQESVHFEALAQRLTT